MQKFKEIVIIGGGTGTYVTLFGLKQYPVNLSAIISMTDSGGSTGKLRDQYGVLPPGDVRQALVALSESEQIWRELFLYRFANGDFEGHNFGNLFLSVLEKLTGSFEKSINLAQTILKTKGEVIPVTLQKSHLNAQLVDGSILKTEALIDQKVKRLPIKKIFLNKPTQVNQKALEALKKAELIILSPGDLYTSILPVFMFKEIVQYYQQSSAKKVLVLNLMNKLGQTDNFQASDFVKVYIQHLGPNCFDYVIVNNHPIDKQVLAHYAKSGESQVINNLQSTTKLKIFAADLISQAKIQKQAGDKLTRSLLRHDSYKLAKFIFEQIIHDL